MSRYTKAIILAVIVCGEWPEAADQIMSWANEPVIDEMYERELLRMKVGYLI